MGLFIILLIIYMLKSLYIKVKKNWKNDTPINLKNNENFTFEILKLPQGLDSPFFDFSNLSNQLLWI